MDYFCFEKINELEAPLKLYVDESYMTHKIAYNLKKYRLQTTVNQQTMANAFSVSLSQYRKYEKGIDLPKMHSVARWSIMTGSPNTLLLDGTSYMPYLKSPKICWKTVPFLCTIAHASDLTFNSLLSLSKELINYQCSEIITEEKVPNLSAVLIDIEQNYYIKVAKNMKLIRQHLGLSQEALSEVLGLSNTTYRQYEKECNYPRIPFTFFARSHAILQLRNHWIETGTSNFSLFNRRRYKRISLLSPIIQQANEVQIKALQSLFNPISKTLIEQQISDEVDHYQSIKKTIK